MGWENHERSLGIRKPKYGASPAILVTFRANNNDQRNMAYLVNLRDNDGYTPLSHAAWYGNDDAVRILLGVDGIEVNSRDNKGRTPLSYAARNSKTSTVEILLTSSRKCSPPIAIQNTITIGILTRPAFCLRLVRLLGMSRMQRHPSCMTIDSYGLSLPSPTKNLIPVANFRVPKE